MINTMRKNGFTLMELLVVIAIISILTIVTVGQFNTAKKKANDVARKGDLNAVSKALQMYFTDYGVFPPVNKITWGNVFTDVTGYVYMKLLPVENYTNIPYCYKISLDGKKYALYANLENTTDKECTVGAYSCGGRSNAYCYGVTSPNTNLSEMNDVLP